MVQALLSDASGNPLAGVVVTFTTSDKTASLVPASGSALTDAAGIAQDRRRRRVARPAAFAVTANATTAPQT